MTDPQKCSLKKIQLSNGETLFLSVEWLTHGLFNIEAFNGVSAWKALNYGYPVGISMRKEMWLNRASEAFGFQANPSKEFWFEFCSIPEPGIRELRWHWNEDGEKTGFARLFQSDSAESINRFLSVSCNVSNALTVLAKESRATQVEVEKEMDAVRKEVKEAVRSRRTIYARCEKMIKEKNQQLKQLLEKQGESAATVENEDLYSALTTDQDAQK